MYVKASQRNFTTERNLAKLTRNRHPAKERAKCPCRVCEVKSWWKESQFIRRFDPGEECSHLQTHQKIHPGGIVNNCPESGDYFHQNSFHPHHSNPTGEKSYRCDSCGKTLVAAQASSSITGHTQGEALQMRVR